MKKLGLLYILILFHFSLFAQTSVLLTISGIKYNNGKVYISLFNSEQAYNERSVFLSANVAPENETISISLTMPEGEYLFSVLQDSNENGKLDTNMFGIPKEPVGLSHYNGKGIPGNFDKHKVLVSSIPMNLTVQLHKIY
jgi:uncharacterized protein (DUF2141 family)